jgi:hypothetical protein
MNGVCRNQGREVVVRRFTRVGLALAAGALTAAIAVVPASAASSSTSKKPKPIKVTAQCTSNVSIVVPAGQQGITPPVNSGHEYGSISCPKVGSGVISQSLTQDDAGDLTGTYTAYFATGSVHGKYTLTQQPGLPSSTTGFFSATFLGTSTVAGGTGTYKNITGKGTWNCSTMDGVHTTCTGKLKVVLPPVTKA